VAKAFRKFIMAAKGGLAVATDRYRPIKDNSDIGKRRGPKSPKGVIQIEAQRRLEDGEVPADMTHKAFANKLHDWFTDTWPDAKAPAELMIERYTRDLWRQYRG
jgi:hypothetical protein